MARANLIQTCGKCHAGANAGFVSYAPHADPHNGQAFPLLHASSIFMNLLLASALGFFALHTLLWFIRSHAEKSQEKRSNSMSTPVATNPGVDARFYTRFTPSQRALHASC